jgi:nitrite reductase/ring-hydroxylating ferredoxin subunit
MALCLASDVAPGEMRRVDRDDGPPLAIFNVDGSFHVTDDTCTHAQASLTEGDLEGDEVVCPVHMGTFRVTTGEPVCFPARRALRTYAVVVEDGVVVADLTRELAPGSINQ